MASCPVCAHEGISIERLANEDAYDVNCRRCKAYVIDGDLFASCRTAVPYERNFPLPAHEMSGVVRNAAERGEPLRLPFKTLDDLLKATPVPTEFHARCDLLLLYIAKLAGTNHQGFFEVHVSLDASITYATSCKPYLSGLIEDECIEASGGKYRIRSPGWRRVKEASATTEKTHTASSAQSMLAVAPHFEIEKRVGCGRDAEVYCARNANTRQRVAIKFFSESLAVESLVLAHARSATAVTGPNIVQVYEAWRVPHPETKRPTPAIVMEFVDGEVLLEFFGRANTVEDIRCMGLGILDAAEAYRAAGRAHGDMHEENIVISKGTLLVKVLDPTTTMTLLSSGTARAGQDRDLNEVKGHLCRLLGASTLPAQVSADFREQSRKADLKALRAMFLACLQPGAEPVPPLQAALEAVFANDNRKLMGFKLTTLAAELRCKPSELQHAVLHAERREVIKIMNMSNEDLVCSRGPKSPGYAMTIPQSMKLGNVARATVTSGDAPEPTAIEPDLQAEVLARLVEDVEDLKLRPSGRGLTANPTFRVRGDNAPTRERKAYLAAQAEKERTEGTAATAAAALAVRETAKP